MSAAGGIHVSLSDLEQHAGEVGVIAGDLRSCTQRAEEQGGVDVRAWGMIGQGVHAAVEGWIGHANGLLRTCADAADVLAERLKAARRDYHETEQDTADVLDTIRTGGL
jgi:hypothetical protein